MKQRTRLPTINTPLPPPMHKAVCADAKRHKRTKAAHVRAVLQADLERKGLV
jgi:hypothetical protein